MAPEILYPGELFTAVTLKLCLCGLHGDRGKDSPRWEAEDVTVRVRWELPISRAVRNGALLPALCPHEPGPNQAETYACYGTNVLVMGGRK